MIPPPPRSTLYPYTTLFRSVGDETLRIPDERHEIFLHPSDNLVDRGGIRLVVAYRCEHMRCSPSRLSFAISTLRAPRSEEHTSELQSRQYLVCRLLLEKQKT